MAVITRAFGGEGRQNRLNGHEGPVTVDSETWCGPMGIPFAGPKLTNIALSAAVCKAHMSNFTSGVGRELAIAIKVMTEMIFSSSYELLENSRSQFIFWDDIRIILQHCLTTAMTAWWRSDDGSKGLRIT